MNSVYKTVLQALKALCVPYKDPCTGEIVNPDGTGTFSCEDLNGCKDVICDIIAETCPDTNTQNTVTSTDGTVVIVESPNADGEINYDLSSPQKQITSTGGTVIITDSGNTCNLEIVDTNTQSSTTSNDGSVVIVTTTNSEGEANYDLSVVSFDDTDIQCKLDLLCNATVTVTDCQQISSFTTPTNTFTITDPDFLEVCSIALNGGGLDLNESDVGGYSVNGNVITTFDMWGSPTNPCIGYIFYKKQVKLIDCTSC